jgi:hypothetical protein
MGKKTLIFLILLGIYITSLFIEGESKIVKGHFEMLACEKCYHMEVLYSSDPDLISKTIVPRSSVVDMDKVIGEGISNSNLNFCMRGNIPLVQARLPFIQLDPDGIKFDVKEALPMSQCQ